MVSLPSTVIKGLPVVTFGGREIAQFSIPFISVQTAVNQIPHADITLQAYADSVIKGVVSTATSASKPGTTVVVTGADKKVLFSGIVTRQHVSISQGNTTIRLRVRHPLCTLQASLRTQVFADKTDTDIVKALLKSIPEVKKVDAGRVKHEQMIQLCCSDWDFLRARVRASQAWLLASAKGVSVTRPALSSPAVTLADTDALFSWEFNAIRTPKATDMFTAGWDAKNQKMTTKVHPQSVKIHDGSLAIPSYSLAKNPWGLLRSVSLSPDEHTALVNGTLMAHEAAKLRVTAVSSTLHDFTPGDTLGIKMPDAELNLNGKGIITEVRHVIEGHNWTTTVLTGLPSPDENCPPLIPPAEGVCIGIVDAIKEDPTGMGRLRVKIPSLELDTFPVWARFSSPYATNGMGFCFYPETGDEVILAFFSDDPRYPVVLGSMHSPKNKTPLAYTKDNAMKKGIFLGKDDAKQIIEFDEKELNLTLLSGKEKLIFHKGIQASSEEESISVTAAKSVTVKAKKIDVAAQSEGMALSADGDVTIKGKEIDLDAQSDLKIKAGAQLEATGGAQTTIKGGAKATIKAPIIALDK